MYKQIYRVFSTSSKKVSNGVKLSTTAFLNNNFVTPVPAISKILSNSSTHNITRRYYVSTNKDFEPDSEIEFLNPYNPSVEVQKRIQKEAQDKLDVLIANNPAIEKLKKVIELELEVLRQSGAKVPVQIRPSDWLQLVNKKTENSRRRFMEFMWTTEIKRKSKKFKMQKKMELMQSSDDEEEDDESRKLKYGLRNNSMFIRISKSTMSDVLNCRLISAMMFGEKLIIDCGFESHMNIRELSSLAKQLMFAFVANRLKKDPFDIHLCNLDPNGELYRRILSFYPTMENSGYPINVTSQSYLEIFPKEKLLYLTPHTQNVMHNYNPDDIYIIGAIVDKTESKPLTIAKAKEEGIRVAKFPLDSFMDWKAGSGKNLNINHCVEIMLDMKETRDWKRALKVVPSRKIIRPLEEYPERTSRVLPVFKNHAPKFSSGGATQPLDFSYYKRVKQND